ncbi:hypothetical protein [Mesorhizobium xinjiangense]|uniref:hypothetical protein n=1 Tax=Mesorhizobium xinjiangense TaxID=2678685 RepID=UPI0012ED8715|nr:hypothetical protein [Mesorhizobium xinjiangense]
MYEIIGAAFTLNSVNEEGRLRCSLQDIAASLATSESGLWAELLALAKAHPLIIETSDRGDISLTFTPGKFGQPKPSTATLPRKRIARRTTGMRSGKTAAKAEALQKARTAALPRKSIRRPVVAAAENDAKVLEAVMRIGQKGAPANPMPKGNLAQLAGVPKGSIHGILQRLTKDGRITAKMQAKGKYEFAVPKQQ